MPLATVSIEPFNQNSAGLTVISSNLLSRPSASQWYEQWFAVLANEGTSTLCYAQAEVDFVRAGVIVAEHYGYADAAAHGVIGDSSNPCIAPGEVGVVYSNGFADANVNAASVDEIQIIVVGIPSTDPRHPHEPTRTSMATENWTVAGTATASGTIYNIGLDVYAYDDAGLVFERESDHHLETFYSGTTWDYETLSFEAAFTQYEAYIEFLPGAGSRRVGPAPLGWEELVRLREDRAARDAVLRENQVVARTAQ